MNSKEHEVGEGLTLSALLDLLGMSQKRVAVEVNREVVLKSNWPECRLNAQDRVEIVSFVGGG